MCCSPNLHTHTWTQVSFTRSSWSLYELSATCYFGGHIVIGSAASHRTDVHIYDVATNNEDNMHKVGFWETGDNKTTDVVKGAFERNHITGPRGPAAPEWEGGRGRLDSWSVLHVSHSPGLQGQWWFQNFRRLFSETVMKPSGFGAIWFFHSALMK